MDRFAEALLSRQANSALPLEDDWFAPLLGDWNLTIRIGAAAI